MTVTTTLDELNRCSPEAFVAVLGDIYEHSPWVAAQAAQKRPFSSVDDLQRVMFDRVLQSPQAIQIELIRKHPELAGKEAQQDQLTAASNDEQRGAGLDQCSAGELAQLRSLNAAYRERFGFPFVVAVSGLDRSQILDQIEQRLGNTPQQEQYNCIEQIGRIARIRLDKLLAVQPPD